MRKKKEPVILQNVEIESVAAEGNSISHVDGKVLFVPWCIPGDVVDVRVTRKKQSYMEGIVQNMVKPSDLRVEPFCEHYSVCGGCKWQPLPYELQLKFKQQQVEDQLKRIGKLNLCEIEPILGSEKTREYRNKLEFTFSNRRWILSGEDAESMSDVEKLGLGFHITGFFDKVLDIKQCHLQCSPSNEIRLWVRQYAIDNGLSFFDLREQTGLLRNLIVRTTSTGEVMVIVVFAVQSADNDKLMAALKDAFPCINSLYYIVNTKRNDSISDQTPILFSGADAIYEQMEDLRFKIGPKSFYQTNSEQAYRLYSVVREFADLQGNENVYDLYTGTGTIGLFLSNKAKKVVGIEYVPEAIEDAKINAINNNRTNALFFAGDMKDMLTGDFIKEHGKPDIVVLDPPRAGIHPSVAEVLLEAEAPKMVYVSCNPATQARDLALLCEKYDIVRIRPVDMFPHTHHVENVVALRLRENR